MTSAHTNQTPTLGDINNGAPITTGVKVRFDSAGTVFAVRFWVGSTNTGTYTVGLYEVTADDDPNGTGTGTLLASASVGSGSVSADGWAEVAITPQQVVTTSVYCAARHASSGRYVATAGAFNGTDISNGGVVLLATGSDPNPPGLGSLLNGVFNEGAALAYPATNANQPDYFVDVAFTVGITATLALTAAASALSTDATVTSPATLTLSAAPATLSLEAESTAALPGAAGSAPQVPGGATAAPASSLPGAIT